MKQHITLEQLNELSPEAKEKLNQWGDSKGLFPHFVDEPPDIVLARCIGIGIMIEFLIENDIKESGSSLYFLDEYSATYGDLSEVLLCDELWEAVKEVLESDPQ